MLVAHFQHTFITCLDTETEREYRSRENDKIDRDSRKKTTASGSATDLQIYFVGSTFSNSSNSNINGLNIFLKHCLTLTINYYAFIKLCQT